MSTASPARRQLTGLQRRASLPRRADGGLIAVALAGFVLIMIETRGLSFFADEWDFLLDRRGLSAKVLLTPHGPHLVLLPILVYKAMLVVFGSSSYLPFRVLTAADLAGLGVILGIVGRRAWGPWWGLAPMLLLFALGPGSTTILSPFQVGYTLAIGGGVLALVALERRDAYRNVVACACLLVSLASGSQGIGFLIGAAVLLGIRGRWRRDAWVVLVPAILYGLWYLKYGRQASETDLSLWNSAFVYTIDGLASTVSGMFALSTAQSGVLDPTLGLLIVLLAVVALLAAWTRGWRPAPLFWATGATLLTLWLAAAVSNIPADPRAFNDPRYLSSNALLVLVCACATIPRPRLRRGGTIVAAVALAIVVATNTAQYGPERAVMSGGMAYTRAETGALLIMRQLVPPSFSPSYAGNPGIVPNVQAGPFLSAVNAYGDFNSASEPLLRRDPEAIRIVVDQELARGESIAVVPSTARPGDAVSAPATLSAGARVAGHGCLKTTAASVVVRASPGRYQLSAGGQSLSLALARFASDNSVSLQTVAAHTAGVLVIPDDLASNLPWRLDLAGPGARICRLR